METLKDGIKTSEFWVVIISMAINLLIFAGVLTNDGAGAIVALAAVVVSGLTSLSYGGGRVYLKKQ